MRGGAWQECDSIHHGGPCLDDEGEQHLGIFPPHHGNRQAAAHSLNWLRRHELQAPIYALSLVGGEKRAGLLPGEGIWGRVRKLNRCPRTKTGKTCADLNRTALRFLLTCTTGAERGCRVV